jgi:hypothetical protein
VIITMKEPVSEGRKFAVVAKDWRRTLEAIPTLFGRLAYMASLRTGEAGRYQHYGIAQRLGEDGAHELLAESHNEIFRAWLELELEPQKQEVERYIFEGSGFGESTQGRARTLASMIALAPWAVWIPEGSRDAERELYRGDLDVVFELLRREAGVARRDPDL